MSAESIWSQTMKRINEFLRLLKELQTIDNEFPLQYAVCLAIIARQESLSLTELSKQANMSLSTTSRIVGALSKYRQSGQAYELVYVEISKEERRRKEIYLTPKGQTVIQNIEAFFEHIENDSEPRNSANAA